MRLEELVTRPPLCVRNRVFDFVGAAGDYCGNFGEQWTRFRTIQLDSASGGSESRRRFFGETGWSKAEIKGKLLLDAGCGAGRFAEIALEAGANVVAVDISEAAWACRQTLERFPKDRWLVLRGDLLDLPLPSGAFDGVYALGVLQHTADPIGAICCLARVLAPGGRLATWTYERRSPDIRWLQPRTWIRVAVARWPAGAKLTLTKILTGACFPVGWAMSWFGRTGERASHFLPYAARHHLARGNLRRQWGYSVMDTFDWYGPVYEKPQRASDVMRAMKEAGLGNVRRLPARGMAIVAEAPPRIE